MVSFSRTASVFHALGDETRSDIISRLAAGHPMRVSDIAASYAMTRPAVSKHLKILEHAGVVHMEWRGREKFCHLQPEALSVAKGWIARHEQMWTHALGDLSHYLDTPEEQEQAE